MPKSRRGSVLVAAVVATVLAFGSAAPVAAADDPSLLLSYTFDSSSGGSIPDLSGRGNDGRVLGSGATVSGGELRLTGSGFVQMPTGLFDGRNTLTISSWLKNNTAAGNYAALFFGSPIDPPSQYWLLNPKNPDGRFKSVITNGSAPSTPWTTEAGISATSAATLPGPLTTSEYALYTTVITPTSISGYLNGTKIGTVRTTRTVSQFGTGLVSYIGRSSYPDPYFTGSIRDVTVWSSARTDVQIRDDYYDGASPAAIDAALQKDAAALDLGGTVLSSNIVLPTMGASGSSIAWTSSNPSVLSTTGAINRSSTDTPVTLTATLSLRGRTVTRTFPVVVAAAGAQRDLELAADRFDLGVSFASSSLVLPTTFEGAAVAWSSSRPSIIGTTGTVVRPATQTVVELSAVFSRNGVTATRRIPVTVLAQDTGVIGSYIRAGDTDRTDALHLATSPDGSAFTAVNNGRGVLYPTLGSRKIGNPELFRTPHGGFGLIAPVNGSSTQLYVWDSADLVTYTNERLVTFSSIPATRTAVDYDNGILAYRIGFLAAGSGALMEVTTKDFVTFTAPVARTKPLPASSGAYPAGGIDGSDLPVTAAEYAFVAERLGRVVSTGVTAFAPVRAAQGSVAALPKTASVQYSSGSTTTMGVEWDADDVSALRSAAPGTYTVDGTVKRPTYSNPLVERRADPDVTLGEDGWYYFTASYPTVSDEDPEGYDRIILRRAQSIEGLKTAPEIVIWDEASDPVLNRYIWAPELTKIGNSWYVLFTAGRDVNNPFDIRPAALKFTGASFSGAATQDPANWTSLGQVKALPGDVAFSAFSLDMTYLEANGKSYLTWAQYFGPSSVLYMAQIDPADPTRLITPSMMLTSPQFAWEKFEGADSGVDEGPAFLKHDGRVFAAFSASTVDDKYAVGLLSADEKADLLDPKSWTKVQYPLLASGDKPNEVGTGHNSFTVDEFGNPVIVYHARTPGDVSNPGESTDLGLNDPRRHARAATVHWDAAGLPVFNMTPDEELRPQLARVQVQVVVTAAQPSLAVTAKAVPRCVSGKAVVTVTVSNGAAVPVSVTSTTSWGTRTTAAVAPGKSAAHAYTTRAASIAAGSATVTAAGTVNGTASTVTVAAPYPALDCR